MVRRTACGCWSRLVCFFFPPAPASGTRCGTRATKRGSAGGRQPRHRPPAAWRPPHTLGAHGRARLWRAGVHGGVTRAPPSVPVAGAASRAPPEAPHRLCLLPPPPARWYRQRAFRRRSGGRTPTRLSAGPSPPPPPPIGREREGAPRQCPSRARGTCRRTLCPPPTGEPVRSKIKNTATVRTLASVVDGQALRLEFPPCQRWGRPRGRAGCRKPHYVGQSDTRHGPTGVFPPMKQRAKWPATARERQPGLTSTLSPADRPGGVYVATRLPAGTLPSARWPAGPAANRHAGGHAPPRALIAKTAGCVGMLGAQAPVAQHGGPCHGPHGTNSQPAISSPFARTPPRGPHRRCRAARACNPSRVAVSYSTRVPSPARSVWRVGEAARTPVHARSQLLSLRLPLPPSLPPYPNCSSFISAASSRRLPLIGGVPRAAAATAALTRGACRRRRRPAPLRGAS